MHAFHEVLPPTLFFMFSFNLIVFTTNLLIHDYWFKLSGFRWRPPPRWSSARPCWSPTTSG